MPRLSLTRRFLNRITFKDVKYINEYYGLQPRKSKIEMIGQIMPKVGTSLQNLICSSGLYTFSEWNETCINLGGQHRRSLDLIVDEIGRLLDSVYDSFNGDTTIAELRSDKYGARTLADKLGIDRQELLEKLDETKGNTYLSTFVTRIRDQQKSQNFIAPKITGSYRVASTSVQANGLEVLELSWMKQYISNAEDISIAAGFYDNNFIVSLLGNCQSVKRIRMLFNGLGGQRLVEQRQELQTLLDELKNNLGNRKNVDVRLYFSPGMFHSKLFLISRPGSIQALIGSANATTAAFTRNEEILVALEGGDALNDYFNSAWDNAKSLSELDLAANSLIPFFRTGRLYFKPIATLVTSINPFRKLLSLMTDDERQLLGAIALPYADQTTGIGSFSLKLVIKNNNDDMDLSIDEIDDSDTEKQQRASIKPWSVETCLGYWVPSALDSVWQARLQEAGSRKKQKWENFREKLQATPDNELSSKYQEYLDGVRNELKKITNLDQYLCNLNQDPFDTSVFDKFYRQVMSYLQDEDRMARITLPFIDGEMPEIWDDIPAYYSFRTSFFDYLNLLAQSNRERLPTVPKIILSKLDTDESQSGALLENEFEEYLNDNPWKDSDWTK